MIHLTNDAIQKKDKSYGKFEAANKLTYDELQAFISAQYPQQYDDTVTSHIVPTMK